MRDLEAEFREFHTANPHVYDLFDRFTQQVLARGFDRYSSDAILHRVRWHTTIETSDAEGFKINNNWAAFYSRLWMEFNPQYDGFFETRIQKSKPRPQPSPKADGRGQFQLF